MLAVSSAALMAAVMQRSFGVYGGPDFCSWMASPLCDWKLPEAIRTKVMRVLKKEKAEIKGGAKNQVEREILDGKQIMQEVVDKNATI